MRASLRTSLVGALAAATFAFSLAAATPASADWRHHGMGPHFHHGWSHGGGWGPAVGLGVVGALAAGAIIASQSPYYADPAPVYDGCTRWRPAYNQWGRYIGDRPVNVCY